MNVLITAGGSGIGFAMGHAFARAGWQVWVTDIDEDALQDCPDDWERDVVDASDAAAMAKLFDRIGAHWGSLDAVCANAGSRDPQPLWKTSNWTIGASAYQSIWKVRF